MAIYVITNIMLMKLLLIGLIGRSLMHYFDVTFITAIVLKGYYFASCSEFVFIKA